MGSLVSILIPAYNSAKWVADTVRSALNQTWGKKEIIIVDDGSRDATFRVISQFEGKAVKVIRQENQGAAAARNTALSFAQGEYIQWLDSDDLLDKNKIKYQMEEGETLSNPHNLLTCPFGRFFFKTKNANFTKTRLWRNLEPIEWLIIRFTDTGTWMNPATWLVSRRLIEMSGVWNEKLSFDDDGEYFARIITNSDKIVFVENARCYYRIGSTASLSSKRSTAVAASGIESMRLCIRYLLSLEDSNRTRRASAKYIENMVDILYPEVPEIVEMAEELSLSLLNQRIQGPGHIRYEFTKKLIGHSNAVFFKRLKWKLEIVTRQLIDRVT